MLFELGASCNTRAGGRRAGCDRWGAGAGKKRRRNATRRLKERKEEGEEGEEGGAARCVASAARLC